MPRMVRSMVKMSGHLPRGWHALLMSPGSERELLVQVVKEVVGGVAQVAWLAPGDTWSPTDGEWRIGKRFSTVAL